MKTYFYLFIIILVTACTGQHAELETLKIENDSLRNHIRELEQQTWIKENVSQVTLANTALEEITSTYNGQQYQIKISYPKSYFKNESKKYPVLYVIDAETNFGGISYIVQRLIKDQLIPEVLVVGIAYNTTYKNFYRLRSRDLTPVEDKDLRMGNHAVDPTGGAPAFSQFLEFELFPFITKKYRVKQTDRAVYGHSYGGLFGSYALLNQPQLFNRYILLGPSLWFKDDIIVNQLKTESLDIDRATRFYMASGEFEGRIDDLQVEFIKMLEEKNIANLSIASEVVDNETHRTIFGVGFTNGLRFIYGD